MKLIDTPAIQIIQIPMGKGLFAHELQQKYPEFAWTYEPGFGEWEIQLDTYWCLIYKTRVVVKRALWGDFWPQAELFIRLKNCRCPPSFFNWGDCSREEPQCHDPS